MLYQAKSMPIPASNGFKGKIALKDEGGLDATSILLHFVTLNGEIAAGHE